MIRTTFNRTSRGFTLLELLVVMVIVGILVSLLTLSVGLLGEDGALRREAERLEALVQIAGEETMLHGFEMGLRFYRRAYEFSIYRDETDEWIPLVDDRLFRRRDIPEALELDLELEGRDVLLEFEADENREYRPQVFIMSSGDITPFNLRFREAFSSDGYQVLIKADGSAEIKHDEL
jgi:general secretion pathway protein H